MTRRKGRGRGLPPPPERHFGVDAGMVGDALAVWELCACYPEFLRLPPFPFARLAAALHPEWRRSANPPAPAHAAVGLTPATALSAITVAAVTPALATAVGMGTQSERLPAPPPLHPSLRLPQLPYPTPPLLPPVVPVGAEWLATQAGDLDLASECLLRDVHCALLRVIDGDDVEAQTPPHHSKAEGGGGAEPLGWPERVRCAVEAAAPRSVKDAAFGGGNLTP